MTRGWRYPFGPLACTMLFFSAPWSLIASERIDVARSKESQGSVEVIGAYRHESIVLECFAHRADCRERCGLQRLGG